MSYRDVTQQQKVTALRLFLDFEDITPHQVAENLGLTEVQVEEIQKRHGYPDPGKMRMSADMMERVLEGTPEPARPAAPRPVPTPPAAAVRPARPPAAAPSLADIVREARETGDRKLTRLADFDEARKALLLAFQEWRSHEAERRAEAQAKAERDAEIARLEARLAELRGRAKPKPKAQDQPRPYPCDHDGCDFASTAPQGLASHKRMAHDGWVLGPDGWHQCDTEPSTQPEGTTA